MVAVWRGGWMTCDETYLTCQIHLHVVNLGTRVYAACIAQANASKS